jgi:transcriptional regulator with XRE-family HTH domain
MIFTPESLAPALRAGRNALNWTQQAMAEKSGISMPTIARTETSNNPKMDTVLALFRVLAEHGVSFEWQEQGFAMTVNFLQKQLTTTD